MVANSILCGAAVFTTVHSIRIANLQNWPDIDKPVLIKKLLPDAYLRAVTQRYCSFAPHYRRPRDSIRNTCEQCSLSSHHHSVLGVDHYHSCPYTLHNKYMYIFIMRSHTLLYYYTSWMLQSKKFECIHQPILMVYPSSCICVWLAPINLRMYELSIKSTVGDFQRKEGSHCTGTF